MRYEVMRYILILLAVAAAASCVAAASCGSDVNSRINERNQTSINQCVKAGGVPIFDNYSHSDDPLMIRCDTPPNCYTR